MKLIDAVGKAVILSSFSGKDHALDISSLSAGIYILILEDGTRVMKRKIVIE